MASSSSSSSDQLTTLKTQLATLQDLLEKVEPLREIPARLIRRLPSQSPDALNMLIDGPPAAMTPKAAFQEIHSTLDLLTSSTVQSALQAAQESEKTDPEGIVQELKRDRRDLQAARRKKRRAASPPSTSHLSALLPVTTSTTGLFPPHTQEIVPLKLQEIEAYAREFNRSQRSLLPAMPLETSPPPTCQLHIWSRGPSKTLNPSVIMLRFTVVDVFVAYISCSVASSDQRLIPESVTFFGPRERRIPHGQSNFSVFQSLSQQLAKMIQSYPMVSLQGLIDVLVAYKGLFIDACTSCARVLSAEGHVPPLQRLWVTESASLFPIDGADEKETVTSRWEPRHVACRLS